MIQCVAFNYAASAARLQTTAALLFTCDVVQNSTSYAHHRPVVPLITCDAFAAGVSHDAERAAS